MGCDSGDTLRSRGDTLRSREKKYRRSVTIRCPQGYDNKI